MSDLIGGSLSDIEQLAATSREVGEQAGQDFDDVRARTGAFTGEIEELAGRLQRDFEEFTARVRAEAARLASRAEATNWLGLSGDAKRARLERLHADAGAFEGRAMQDVAAFRSSLQALVQDHYDHVATDMATVVSGMREAHQAEADHATSFAAAARDLDQAAAGG